MTTSATGGPIVAYGQLPLIPGSQQPVEYNNNSAPSMFWGGTGLLDPRWGYQTMGGMPHTLGFLGTSYMPTVQSIPSTASTSILGLTSTSTPVSGTAILLATASSTSITVLGSSVQVYPALTVIPAASIALDGLPGQVAFNANASTLSGTPGGIQLYDTTKITSRNIRIQANNADTAYLVSGYDSYGYPMSESIAGTTTTTGGLLLGKKAFKFIKSIVPTGTINSTSVSIGTGDVIGLPVRADGFGDIAVFVNATLITASTGFTAAVTSTASTTTGDVRGTYSLQTASNGTNVIQFYQSPRVGNIGSNVGLFGVTQF